MKSFPEKELSLAERSNAADDWVVLEILDPQAAMAATGARNWASGDLSGEFRIFGFAGGAQSFLQGRVVPTEMSQRFRFRNEFLGCIYLTRDGTVPGISGGGVFRDGDLQFAGIHRSRFDDTLQLCAVSSLHIQARLLEYGFEPALTRPASSQLPQRSEEEPDRTTMIIILSKLTPADLAMLIGAIPNASRQVSHHAPVPQQVSKLVRWAESSTGPGLAAIDDMYRRLFRSH